MKPLKPFMTEGLNLYRAGKRLGLGPPAQERQHKGPLKLAGSDGCSQRNHVALRTRRAGIMGRILRLLMMVFES